MQLVKHVKDIVKKTKRPELFSSLFD